MDHCDDPLVKARAARSASKRTLVSNLLGAMRRVLRAVLLGLAVFVVFIEEWGWGPLSALVAPLAHWPPIAVVESHIRRAPPRVALALFLLPALPLVPVKLLAIYLIQDGRVTLGILIIVAAKLVGTALVGRLFILVEKQLMEFVWFARCVWWWRVTRDRIMAAVRASFLWCKGRALRRRWRNWLCRGRIAPASPSSPGELAATRSFASPVVSTSDGRGVLRHVGAGLFLVPSLLRGSSGNTMMVKLLTFALRVGLVVLLMDRVLKTVTGSVEQRAGAPVR